LTPFKYPGPSFKTRLIVLAIFAVATPVAMLAYGYWATPVVPVFPDVENADGTVDYTLVGTETTYSDRRYPRRRLSAYNKMVVRLPKHLGVTRPLAQGGSVSGGGVQLSYAKNPNASVRVGISWRFLVEGKIDLRDMAAKPMGESDNLSLGIWDQPQRDELARIESFWKWCRLVDQKSEGFVEYLPKANGQLHCKMVSPAESKNEYVLLENGQPLAFVGCRKEVQDTKSTCELDIYHRDYWFPGNFPAQHIEDFPRAYPSLISIIDKSIISQERVVFE
jgi:hypothetical protein